MKFYKDHYDVVIIGGALAGMSACLQLQAWGVKDILILEKHNMPGGLATAFVRNGFEIEATLHEMMSIGQPGQFFDDMGVNIDWLPVPECYRVALPNSGIDKVLHPDYDDSYTTVAKEIDEVCPGTYDKVHELMLLCRRVYDSMNILSVTPMSKVKTHDDHDHRDDTKGNDQEKIDRQQREEGDLHPQPQRIILDTACGHAQEDPQQNSDCQHRAVDDQGDPARGAKLIFQ